MTPSDLFIELDKALHSRQSFDCGSAELNGFIQQYAARHRAAGISRTMVLPSAEVDETGKSDICCYYTLSHSEIKRETLPERAAKRLPHYPIPVMLIAQLAVHNQCQGQGLGKVALIRSLRHCLDVNALLPSFAVIVDALEDGVQEFYKQYGFQVLCEHQGRTRLYLSMKTVEQLFA
ncbi:GNAT family N-acetyltransferase [Porticoccus sp. W117]|uniref:GNAT family N-acetyltransferase n=1 Tax=Porticoccus sp. W117 TaxID=3054777 RepID=UPI0025925C03|nr:GNAT family N-acetyltransferase [Porticoccus sp. W117]MDM3872678.1 GNAT family N-acetyltransferase [Porticoccus sp. W117]